MEKISMPSSTDTPNYLYHYTDAHGLFGILNGEIWATEIRHLNDSAELSGCADPFRRKIHDLFDRYIIENDDSDSKDYATVCRHFINIGLDLPVFLSSWSSKPDLLSQWRGYCPKGGYCIGIKSQALRSHISPQGFTLNQCHYRPPEGMANKSIKAAEAYFNETVTKKASILEEASDQTRGEKVGLESFGPATKDQLILKPAAFQASFCDIKNASFKEECEWRIISAPRIADQVNYEFRPRGAALIPFSKIKVPQESDENFSSFWSGLKIHVGPMPDQVGAAKSLQLFLINKFGEKIQEEPKVFLSQSSLRQVT